MEKNIQKVSKELNPPLYSFVSKIQIILAYILLDSRPRFQHTLKCNYLFCSWFNCTLSAITMHLQFQNIFFYLYYLHDLYKFCSCFDFYHAKTPLLPFFKKTPFLFNQSHLQSQSCSEVLDSPDYSFVHWKEDDGACCLLLRMFI